MCVILALGTQEELNEYLLTKSRLKVIQDIRQNFSVSTVLFVLWKLKRETLTCSQSTRERESLSLQKDTQVGFSLSTSAGLNGFGSIYIMS